VEIRLYRKALSRALAVAPEVELLATPRNCDELEALHE
jgi:hypothetical protein